ncbi:hypothetical protein KQI69_02435 [Eubacterium sp. MSJ-13]|uniref:hypothetical protein n=1 Tax=Eubacterium sp. MSJ-13 TaxID=2841513 RepID=UPI001C11A9A4|nr:hypothetical protein [Eubacterium sp. MSJ-13]MBU5478054.1 hypothetical protein [Eubacterium sp. MSJ-13]
MDKLKEILSHKNVEIIESYIGNIEQDMGDMDKKIENIKALQTELEHRTAVEKLAEKMIIDGKFEEANELLDSLDDDKVRELMEECPEEEIKEVRTTEELKRHIGVRESENYFDAISDDEVKSIEKAVQEEPAPLETQNYFIIPDNDSQIITIMPDIEGAVLKLDKTNALILASIIQYHVRRL